MEDGVKKLRFDLLSNFCVSVLTIPHSTAEIERIFSVLGNIQNFLVNVTKIRNRLCEECLNGLIQLKQLKRTANEADIVFPIFVKRYKNH